MLSVVTCSVALRSWRLRDSICACALASWAARSALRAAAASRSAAVARTSSSRLATNSSTWRRSYPRIAVSKPRSARIGSVSDRFSEGMTRSCHLVQPPPNNACVMLVSACRAYPCAAHISVSRASRVAYTDGKSAGSLALAEAVDLVDVLGPQVAVSVTPSPSAGARHSTPTLPWCRLRCTS